MKQFSPVYGRPSSSKGTVIHPNDLYCTILFTYIFIIYVFCYQLVCLNKYMWVKVQSYLLYADAASVWHSCGIYDDGDMEMENRGKLVFLPSIL